MNWGQLREDEFYIWTKNGQGEERSQFRIKAEEVCLLIIDMQKGALYPEYGLAKVYAKLGKRPIEWQVQRLKSTVVPKLQKLLTMFREEQLKIIHVKTGAELNDLSDLPETKRDQVWKEEKKAGMDMRYLVHSPDMEVIDELAPTGDEIVMNKRTASLFTSTAADFVLRNMGIKYLVVTGAATDGCAGLTAMHGSDLGYFTTMVEDCCVSFLREGHYAFLDLFRGRYGRVTTTEEILSELTSKTPVEV